MPTLVETQAKVAAEPTVENSIIVMLTDIAGEFRKAFGTNRSPAVGAVDPSADQRGQRDGANNLSNTTVDPRHSYADQLDANARIMAAACVANTQTIDRKSVV